MLFSPPREAEVVPYALWCACPHECESVRKREEREETDERKRRQRENKHRSIFRGGLAARF